MSFMMKKKRFKFHVKFEVEELSSVPFVSGVLFAKLRLTDGGNFNALSSKEEVWEHRVRWCAKFEFSCKMTASATTGVLEPGVCRVSVRKEVKGGKSYQKLGFADINLAEFAGAGAISRRFLLEGYDSKRRQDNSTIKVNVDMTLLSGDPCFKAPQPHGLLLPGQTEDELQMENKGAAGDEISEDSMASGSSGFGSLPRKTQRTSLVTSDLGGSNPEMKSELLEKKDSMTDLGHTRSASYASQQSKASGYSSAQSQGCHSRQSSLGSTPLGHTRSPSTGSKGSDKMGSIGRHKKLDQISGHERRVEQTRPDADEIIDELVKDFHIDDTAEVSGLQLFVAKDGTTALSDQQVRNKGPSGRFEQVVMEQR